MKKDNGIIPGMGISEELRDQLKKRDWSKPQTHESSPDTWTSRECTEKRFSGFRINVLTADVELWMVGKIVSSKRQRTVVLDPGILGDMIEEGCATNGSLIEVDESELGKRFTGKGAKGHGKR